MKNIRSSALFLIAFIFAATIASRSTFISILFFFAFLLLASFATNKEYSLFNKMLHILFPFELVLLLGIFTTPLERRIITMENPDKSSFYFLLLEIGTYLTIALVSKLIIAFVIPFFSTEKKEKIALNIGLIFFFVYQIYYVYRYATPYFFEVIFTLLILIFALLTYIILLTLSEKQELKLQVEQQRIEQEYLQRYSNEMQNQYRELRKFRHDYINILASLNYFIEQNDLAKLKDYFNNHILLTQIDMGHADTHFQDLSNIHSEEIKSIIALKLILAKEQDIDITLEVPDTILIDMPIDPIIIVRMLGIILDNSIEEVLHTTNNKIKIGLFDMDDFYLFVIKNPITKQMPPLHVLTQEGFSTKGSGRGLGLSTLKSLSDKEKRLTLETTITNNSFIQKIAILKGDD
ncbi:MAG: GHKL domain-containing protein [Vagococcus sp.]|uniref:GHKL domain-containing protein n=1 Tax=Vagococcus sp. TaxID=1933889 RepID=UPI002FCBCC71